MIYTSFILKDTNFYKHELFSNKMAKIEEIVQKSAEGIKQILLEESQKLVSFPTVHFGMRDPKYDSNKPVIGETLLGSSPDVRSRGISVPKDAILVHDTDKFWTETFYIFMLPDGLYRFRASIFLKSRDGEPTHQCNAFPDWESKTEEPKDYIVYGEKALYEMEKILERQEVNQEQN